MKVMKYAVLLALVLSIALPIGLAVAKGPGGGETTFGNNLSYPVLWAEGVTKVLRGEAGMTPLLDGIWYYTWGTYGSDPNVTPASCLPDPDANDPVLNPDGLLLCDDGIPLHVDQSMVAGTPPADSPQPLAKAFVQKDQFNEWQAGSADVSSEPLSVHWIDWGDNLESVDWTTRSQVRTEIVLFQDLIEPMLEYEMRHTSGWGIDEEHGLGTSLANDVLIGPGTRATVYSHCARLTIQKLLVDRDDSRLADLVWEPGVGWTEPDPYADELINPAIFNKPVHEGGDGPGYYSAEINVKGRIIYGYTWNIRDLHDDAFNTPAGDYRITFSFDQVCGTATLNTYFVDGVTQILVPVEEVIIAEEPGGGGAGVLVPALFDETGTVIDGNLTYMDVHIIEREGGPGGGGGNGHGGN